MTHDKVERPSISTTNEKILSICRHFCERVVCYRRIVLKASCEFQSLLHLQITEIGYDHRSYVFNTRNKIEGIEIKHSHHYGYSTILQYVKAEGVANSLRRVTGKVRIIFDFSYYFSYFYKRIFYVYILIYECLLYIHVSLMSTNS